MDAHFDVCVIDTHPNPDIRVIAALATADYVLSPLQLNQEAIDGVRALLHHQRVGFHKIRAMLNPKLTPDRATADDWSSRRPSRGPTSP